MYDAESPTWLEVIQSGTQSGLPIGDQTETVGEEDGVELLAEGKGGSVGANEVDPAGGSVERRFAAFASIGGEKSCRVRRPSGPTALQSAWRLWPVPAPISRTDWPGARSSASTAAPRL